MENMIKIEDRNGLQFVNARELHESLGVGRDFSSWIKERIEKYGFLEGNDYEKCSPDLGSGINGGQNRVEYLLSVSMAKELTMVENNDKGREIRQYLIKIESAWNSPEMIMARALQMASKTIEGQNKQIAEMKPKAEFYDQVADSKDALDMRSVAAILNIDGMGRTNLFAALRTKGILDSENKPYRKFQDAGYFRVIETKYTDLFGETHINTKTLVYQRGLEYIRKSIAS